MLFCPSGRNLRNPDADVSAFHLLMLLPLEKLLHEAVPYL